jgi:hypothetical protein
MTDTRAELRRLAEAANSGEWDSDVWICTEDSGCAARGPHRKDTSKDPTEDDGWPGSSSENQSKKDSDFIASANPAAVLSLLDALDAAEREIDALRVRLLHVTTCACTGCLPTSTTGRSEHMCGGCSAWIDGPKEFEIRDWKHREYARKEKV